MLRVTKATPLLKFLSHHSGIKFDVAAGQVFVGIYWYHAEKKESGIEWTPVNTIREAKAVIGY